MDSLESLSHLLVRNHPVGVILSALLFAVLQHGGIYVDGFSEHVTKDIVQVLQGIIILFLSPPKDFSVVHLQIWLAENSRKSKTMKDNIPLLNYCGPP